MTESLKWQIITSNTYSYYMRIVRWALLKIKDVDSLLLKFMIIINTQYLVILNANWRMVKIKNKKQRVAFIQVYDNHLRWKKCIVFIIYQQ